jgi:glycosidase
MGYDIADYKDIDHRYGSLEDVDRLIAELKKRDMRLVMDLVSTACLASAAQTNEYLGRQPYIE